MLSAMIFIFCSFSVIFLINTVSSPNIQAKLSTFIEGNSIAAARRINSSNKLNFRGLLTVMSTEA